MLIEDIVKNDPLVMEAKEKPVVYTLIVVASVAMACLSFTYPQNGNIGFAMTFFSIVIAVIGLKGIIWPKRYYKFKVSEEKIVRKEYYFDMAQLSDVQKCVAIPNPVHCMEMIGALPQNGATNMRVVIYTTKGGDYFKSQVQKYVPYEYIPV